MENASQISGKRKMGNIQMYDPAVSQVSNEDPVESDAGDANPWRYCGINPLVDTDPSGETAESVAPLRSVPINLSIYVESSDLSPSLLYSIYDKVHKLSWNSTSGATAQDNSEGEFAYCEATNEAGQGNDSLQPYWRMDSNGLPVCIDPARGLYYYSSKHDLWHYDPSQPKPWEHLGQPQSWQNVVPPPGLVPQAAAADRAHEAMLIVLGKGPVWPPKWLAASIWQTINTRNSARS